MRKWAMYRTFSWTDYAVGVPCGGGNRRETALERHTSAHHIDSGRDRAKSVDNRPQATHRAELGDRAAGLSDEKLSGESIRRPNVRMVNGHVRISHRRTYTGAVG